jgi:hypothetical protein
MQIVMPRTNHNWSRTLPSQSDLCWRSPGASRSNKYFVRRTEKDTSGEPNTREDGGDDRTCRGRQDRSGPQMTQPATVVRSVMGFLLFAESR